MQTNVKMWQIGNKLSKGPKNQVTSHLHGATAGQTLAASRRLLLKQFPVLPELKWGTDDAQVVGNQQNGGRTHILSGRWNAREERVKSDN